MNFSTIKNLKLVGVAGRGGAKERVILRAVNACNLARYAVIQGVPGAQGVSSTNQLAYWFPDVEVEAGDYVLLYSGNGRDTVQVDQEGDTLHIYHWTQASSVWPVGKTPIVVYVTAITYKGR